jgi:hypothetical protein
MSVQTLLEKIKNNDLVYLSLYQDGRVNFMSRRWSGQVIADERYMTPITASLPLQPHYMCEVATTNDSNDRVKRMIPLLELAEIN